MNADTTTLAHTLAHTVGHTPLVQLTHLAGIGNNTVLAKLEGNNPAGSVKDRPAYSMIRRAQERGEIKAGDTLIEATSGNTGIALAMVAAMLGYKMRLIMPDNMTLERRAAMKAYGAELVLVTQAQGMEYARDLALDMQANGEGKVLNQFDNPDNPRAHFETTAPEIWAATDGKLTHFVATMGTTGTIMGHSRYFKAQNPAVQIVGVQPDANSSIAGIRKWPQSHMPKIYDPQRVDRILEVSSQQAIATMRALAQQEGIFAGVSSGGSVWGALQLCQTLENAVIACIICDRGDRYLSTGVYEG
jgi:cysteine synthase B